MVLLNSSYKLSQPQEAQILFQKLFIQCKSNCLDLYYCILLFCSYQTEK